MTGDNRNRIPASESRGFDSWSLPAIEGGTIIEAVKAKRQDEVQVDDVELDSEPEGQAISAEELQRITEEGYQQGYQDGKQQGYQDAQQQGYQDGLQAAKQEAEQQMQQQLQPMLALMQRLQQPLQQHEQALEGLLLQLLKEVCQAVIRREMQTSEETLQSLLRESIGLLPATAQQVVIHLNATDLELLQSILPLDPSWRLQADSQIERGGCRVETAKGRIDNTIQRRLDQVWEQLLDRSDSAGAITAAENGAGVSGD